jgi:hypothetical protein
MRRSQSHVSFHKDHPPCNDSITFRGDYPSYNLNSNYFSKPRFDNERSNRKIENEGSNRKFDGSRYYEPKDLKRDPKEEKKEQSKIEKPKEAPKAESKEPAKKPAEAPKDAKKQPLEQYDAVVTLRSSNP